ncbi:MAG: hypothetical protein FJY19_07325 [Bacteroidetes bacterium]|nr:hypothetical protein [Bacteroidota bacterium]
MKFETSLDKLTKVITVISTILFAVVIVGFLSNNTLSNEPSVLIAISILPITYIGVLLFRPISYSLSAHKLTVIRPLKNIEFKLKEIEKVELLDNAMLKGTIRTFGVGGLFGYWGKFYNRKIGTMTWYATRWSNAVLITTKSNSKIVLTPDQPDIFIAELTKTITETK